jgi:hypothetical protein
MLVRIGPAKRPGMRKVIYDKAIEANEVSRQGDRAVLTICAEGLYGRGGSYRYEFHLAPEDLRLLVLTNSLGI